MKHILNQLFSSCNLNQSLNNRSQFNTNNNEMMTTLKRSNKISQSMIDDFKQSIPLNVIKMKESYKKMRKSESDLFNMYNFILLYLDVKSNLNVKNRLHNKFLHNKILIYIH